MATNDFIGFASNGNANVMSQTDYAAAVEQGVGVQPGMASSALANKVWRQGANMAAVIGELIKNHGIDALDNGDLTTLYSALLLATASTTLAGLMSAADKTKLDGLISTDATPTAAGYMSAADKTKLDGLISTDATPTAAGYMSAADKTALDNVPTTYLPLSGGTLTGDITTKNIIMSSGAICTLLDSQAFYQYGGTGWQHGAQITLFGKDHSTNPGDFTVRADNGTDSCDLFGRPDGTLLWNGKSIVNNGAYNKMFFSQTSGSYTAPYTGVYRITLKGGGGGGAGCQSKNPGGGGGEGGTVVFYVSLIKSTSYSYTIGAGGTAGAGGDNAVATSGGNGGTSSMVVNGVTYSAYGGTGGKVSLSFSGAPGGSGAPESAYIIQGAPGQSALNNISTVSSNYFLGASGGGNGGGVALDYSSRGTRGGGGGGGSYSGSASRAGATGGDGYILIEYAG